MKKYLTLLNIIFLIQLAVVFLVAVELLPRFFIIPLTILIALYVLFDSVENSSIFFVRSIPFFVAIPLTSYFDSFNIWRIASGLIFLKWFFKNRIIKDVVLHVKEIIQKPFEYLKSNPVTVSVGILFFMSLLSLLAASDLFSGIKRIIYIANLSLVGFVIYAIIKKSAGFSKRIVSNLLVPGIIVTIVGLVQLISVYYLTFHQFINFWGNIVQRSWYGNVWANIAINSNTWFAYFGSQLSLRMFSTFPDSHTFPMFLLFSIPSLFAIALYKIVGKDVSWKRMMSSKLSVWMLFLPIMYLGAILSGTRGIWLAILGPIIFLPFLIRKIKERADKKIFLYIASFFLIFFLLFLIANPILTSNQFKLEKSDTELLKKRVKSILDLGELSNSGRIYIWKETLGSIAKRPLLGVGVGNFPTVLKQDVELAKAGSSAHNLYLNIAAEIGLVGLFAAIYFLWAILARGFRVFQETNDNFLKIYAGSAVLYFIWILFYSLTDAALFDERVFLIFITHAALLLGLCKQKLDV